MAPAAANNGGGPAPPNGELLPSQNQIRQLITETIAQECPRILNSILNPISEFNLGSDQIINEDQRANLTEMDKIPDIVRSLREFSGQPGEFSSWKKSVDRVLKIYESTRGSPKYYGILSVIRNKIVGQADIALESYNTPLNWEQISRCLALHYADKRDLGTLEYQMTCLVQGNSTVQGFYQTVYHHLSLILNKISSMEMSNEAMNVMVRTYRDKALDTFIRGLKGDLPKLLGMREPADLPQALHLCLKLENMSYRIQHAHLNNGALRRMEGSSRPPVPPRRIPANQNYAVHTPKPQYFPETTYYQRNHNFGIAPLWNNPPNRYPPAYNSQFLANQPLRQNSHNNQTQNQNTYTNSPAPPRPPPRVEPMDVDRSIRSNVVNYQNRPQLGLKRTNWSNQAHNPSKLQRTFHTTASPPNDDLAEYNEKINSEDGNYDQTLIDYLEIGNDEPSDTYQYQEPELIEPEDSGPEQEPQDVHFLG